MCLMGATRSDLGTKSLVKTAIPDLRPMEEEEAILIHTIDEFLAEVRYSTLVEGAKVRDLLLDLRQLVKTPS